MTEDEIEVVSSKACPVCEEKLKTTPPGTALCGACHIKRFFADDPREIQYRTHIKSIEETLKKRYKEQYTPAIHRKMIEQLARSEVQCEWYEIRIANNQENAEMPKLLQNERVHLRALYGILNTSLQAIIGEKKTVQHDFGDNFKDNLKANLKVAMGIEEASEDDKPGLG